MPNVELANTSNAVAIYSQPEALKEKITEWVQKPSTYDAQAQTSFVQAINRFAIDLIDEFKQHVISSEEELLRAIEAKRNLDVAALKLKPSLIAKSFGCGSLGGLAAAQIATQVTVAMAIASCATPAGWIGGTGTAMVYYHFDKQDQEGKICSKALLNMESTSRVAEKMLSSLALGRLKTENSRLNRVNADLNTQIATIKRNLNVERGRITTLRNTQVSLQTRNTNLNTQLDTAKNRITVLETSLTTATNSINSLDGNVTTLRTENQNLRTDLASNQTSLTTTAARIDELQTQNALNLASVQQMNRDLIAEMRSEFQDRERANVLQQEDRERAAAAKQIAERSIEKALRQEQEKKISQLIFDLTRKSAAFEVLQSEHDQLTDQIGHKFDAMTQAMSRNPHEDSVSELLRSNDQHDVSGSDSESNGDFIEIAH